MGHRAVRRVESAPQGALDRWAHAVPHGLDLNAYPLAVKIGIAGPIEQAEQLQAALGQPLTNRDESKMTLVAMTGVTAMSRDFAASMDVNGVLYPAEENQGLV